MVCRQIACFYALLILLRNIFFKFHLKFFFLSEYFVFRYVREMTQSRHPAYACVFCVMIMSFFILWLIRKKKNFAFDTVILTKKFGLCAMSHTFMDWIDIIFIRIFGKAFLIFWAIFAKICLWVHKFKKWNCWELNYFANISYCWYTYIKSRGLC